jgi:hypothetical protein
VPSFALDARRARYALVTKIVCAETHRARGEARSSTVPTISSTDASRPETCAFLTYSTDCAVSSPWKNGVSTAPGATVFTVTPRAPSSLASAVHALVVPGRHRPAKIEVALELLRERVPRLPGVD